MNSCSPLRRLLCRLPFRLFLVALTGALVFAGAAQSFRILVQYTESPAAVRNVFRQGRRFDYRTSVPFLEETETLFRNILQYALVYQDIENFSSADQLRLQLEAETAQKEKQIALVTEVAQAQANSGDAQQDYLDRGFLKRENGRLTPDPAAIRAWYEAEYARLMEGLRRAGDEKYQKLAQTLDALRGVRFAVVRHAAGTVVSNCGLRTKEAARATIEKQPLHLVLRSSRTDADADAAMRDLAELAMEAADDYDEAFDFYISLPQDLHFNDVCDTMEETCRAVYRNVSAASLTAGLCAVGAVLLTVLLVLFAVRRASGEKKASVAGNRLLNDLYLAILLVLGWFLFSLVRDSVYLVLHPHLDLSGLTVHATLFAVRGSVCVALLWLVVLAGCCMLRRQIANRSLLLHTLVGRLLRKQPPDPPEPTA